MSSESTRWPPPPLHSLWRCTYLEQVHDSNLDTLEQYVNVCVCFSVATQCASPGGPGGLHEAPQHGVFGAEHRGGAPLPVLCGGCAHGAQRHVRPRGALRRAARRGRVVGGSDDYYLKRGGGGGAEGGGDGAE